MGAEAGLALAAFLAATLLPGGSELLLVGLLGAGHAPAGLWLAATLGNTAGGLLNWALGRWLLHWQDRPWFPFRPEGLGRAAATFRRFGLWTLLFTWLPVVGDPLTFLAGVLRVPLRLFLPLCALGKGGRYAVLILMAQSLGAG